MKGFSGTVCIFLGVFVWLFGLVGTEVANAEEPIFSQRIVMFNDHVGEASIAEFRDEWKSKGVSVVMELPLINGLVLFVPDTVEANHIADDPRIAAIEADRILNLKGAVRGQYGSFIRKIDRVDRLEYPWSILRMYDEPFDPDACLYDYEPERKPDRVSLALRMMERRKARIAVFDTGIHPGNRIMKHRLKGGIDLVNTAIVGGMKKGRVRVGTDDSGHGTHVAGIIAATLDGKGMWGKGGGVELYSVKMLNGHAMGELSSIIMGLQWVIDQDIDIVNMSIGYKQDSPMIREAVAEASKAGVVIIAAAGNRSNWDDSIVLSADGGAADGGAADGGAADGGAADGGAADGGAADGGAADGGAADGGAADGGAADVDDDPLPVYSVMYPARYPEVIAVGASNAYGELAEFSNSGEEMDLKAPGVNVVSQDITNGDLRNGLGFCSGTSQAAPHVTAAVAMMLALDSDLLAPEIETILKETTTPDGEIDLDAALERVMQDRERINRDRHTSKLNREAYREQLRKKIRGREDSLWIRGDIDS